MMSVLLFILSANQYHWNLIYSYAIVIEETKAYMVQLLFDQNYPDDLVNMFLLYYNGRLWSKFQVSTETCAILVPHKIKQKVVHIYD